MTEVQILAKIKVLKDLLNEYELLAKYNSGTTDYDRYCALEIAIKALEQKPKTGHWESTIDGKPMCSECGFVSESEDGYFVSHFCPNCGAKMESEG